MYHTDIMHSNYLENYIDGQTLAALPYDIEEFKVLVPQCGIRMKIKTIISKHWDMEVDRVRTNLYLTLIIQSFI